MYEELWTPGRSMHQLAREKPEEKEARQNMLTRLTQTLLALIAVAIISACATQVASQPQVGTHQISSAMLLNASPLAAGAELEDMSQIDILGLSPEMITFVDSYIEEHYGRRARLRRLLYGVMGEGKFELVYDETTRTARETFQDQRGNCLSFTNMFVAMARQAGLEAYYQEVEVPPLWSSAGQSFLLSNHINVHIGSRADTMQVVDFNINDFTTTKDSQIIPDNRARAHYFNNIGVEHMLGGDTLLALANFRQSIMEDRSFSPAWINLGTLHRRDGYPEYAETAYLQALEAAPANLVAMSNLANLYQGLGHNDLAAEYRKRVRAHRMRNPYYRFQLANEAFMNGDYDAAIRHVRYAIRQRDDEPRFYSLLSFSYMMSGDRGAARRWMKKAEAVAEQEDEKVRYHHKLELLMSEDSGS